MHYTHFKAVSDSPASVRKPGEIDFAWMRSSEVADLTFASYSSLAAPVTTLARLQYRFGSVSVLPRPPIPPLALFLADSTRPDTAKPASFEDGYDASQD